LYALILGTWAIDLSERGFTNFSKAISLFPGLRLKSVSNNPSIYVGAPTLKI
jgi:hypothetical protein